MNPMLPWIEHLMQDEKLSYAQARAYLEGWEAHPFVDEHGKHLATLIKKGAEVHFAAFRQYRGKGGITRKRLRQFFAPLLEQEGFLVTKLAPGEPDAFIRRLGFGLIGESVSHRIYMLNDITPLCGDHRCAQ